MNALRIGRPLDAEGTKKSIRVIAEEDLEQMFSVLETMDSWAGSMARGMIALCFGTGVRPSELRLAHFEDLDLKRRTLFVRHPKGEGSWASAKMVDNRYLSETVERLKEAGIEAAIALFPSPKSTSGFYSANSVASSARSKAC